MRTGSRVLIVLVVLLCALQAVPAAAPPATDLVVEKCYWYLTAAPGQGPGGHKLAHVAGVIRNASKDYYDSVVVEISIIDVKKGTKIKTQRDIEDSLAPGDRWEFKGRPPIWVYIDRYNPIQKQYMGRIDKVWGVKSRD